MNICTEQAKKAANENPIVKKLLDEGWQKVGFYEYQDGNGNPSYWRIRLDPPNNSNDSKWVRPLSSFDGNNWVLKEPRFAKGKKPLYLLPIIKNAVDDDVIYVVEGEKCADALIKRGIPATTSGSAASAGDAEWSVLTGKQVIIWRDNDDAGFKYAQAVTEQLERINCGLRWVDVAQLNIKLKGDCVDWLVSNPNATAEEIKSLPIIMSPQIKDVSSKPTDFNDLATLEGIEEVRNQLERSRFPEDSVDKSVFPEGFFMNEIGLFFQQKDKEGNELLPLYICSTLKITSRTSDTEGLNHGRLFEFQDHDGKIHQWAMPMEMLAGDGTEYRRNLLSMGLNISPNKKAREKLTDFIQLSKPEQKALCVDKIGWHDQTFVFPKEIISQTNQKILFQSQEIALEGFNSRGSLSEWQDHISKYCVGNSRLILAVSAGFAAPLLYLLGEESGGFHFRGQSSTGKTTVLKVACSVWGSPERLQCWRTTSNGLEGVAKLHNDSLLCLDELSQMNPIEAGETAYMLANGTGKIRASKEGLAKRKAVWRLLFISSGEIGLADSMMQCGKKFRAGQEVRFVDIDADAKAGLGIFENLHGFKDGSEFSRHFVKASEEYYGTPIREFLEQIVQKGETETLIQILSQLVNDFMGEVASASSDGQVKRVAGRFALVAAAGELASKLGITGWTEGEAIQACKKCFNDWINSRGGMGSLDEKQIISQVREFFQKHAESRFSDWQESSDSQRINNRAGFRKSSCGEVEFLVETEVFRNEICIGFDRKLVIQICIDHGFLIIDGQRKSTKNERAPDTGKQRRFYCFSDKVLGDENHAD